MLFLTAASQSCWALMHELVPGKHLGGVSGFVHLMGNISGIIGPTVTGFAVQYFGGYGSAFALGATIDVVGVLAMVFVINGRATQSQPAVSRSAA